MDKITKAIASQWLADVPPEKQFWRSDGRSFKNLSEFQAALGEMGENTFRDHANETKNDFTNWVRDVIGDEKLARDLLKCKTQAQATKVVADRIAWLRSK